MRAHARATCFTLSPFLKKVEKSMPKGSPQIVFFDEKCPLGRPRVDLFSHFGCFLRVRKITVFLTPSWDVKKSKKSDLGAPRGRQGDFDYSAGVPFRHRGVPIPMKRKTVLQQNSKTRTRDPDTPMGRRPGEFKNESYVNKYQEGKHLHA